MLKCVEVLKHNYISQSGKKMNELSVAVLEGYLQEAYKDTATEQGLFMKLVEEVGETAEILNIRAGRKAGAGDTTTELACELVDIIHYAVSIAAINNIDLSKAIIEKDKKAAIKYRRTTTLEEYMKK